MANQAMQSRSAREVNDYKYLQVRNEEYETLRELWWTGPNAYDSPPDHWLPGKCMLVSSMPVELLFMVCGHLYQADLMHLAVTCKTMADFTLPLLYTRDVAEFDCIALRWACTTGVTATLERTLQYGAPPNYFFDTHGAIDCDWVLGGSLYNDTYNTPLKIAICADEPEAVRLLCEKGIDVNTPDFGALQSDVNFWPLQFYPINWALGSPDMPPRKPGAQLGNPKIVRYLLDAGADPNQYSIDCFRLGPRQRGATHSTTPLLMAMHSSVPVETVRLLLERGADPTMVGSCLPTDYRERSQSPLDVLLLSYGLDIPGFAFDWEKAGLLLSHGSAEHTICLRSGRFMPLLYRYLDFPEIAKLARLFIDAGADLFDWTNWGVPPILAVMWWAGARILDSCDAVDVKETTRLVTTMGELVALFAEATVVTDDETDTESPIRKSAIIDATPAPFLDAPMRKADQTPLRYACSPFTFVGANLLVPILLNHGANINGADAEGVTPLHLAAMFSTGHVVRTLTEFNGGPATLGLDVNSRDARGWTPLHYACQFGFWSTQAQQVDAARLLLKSGADVRARTAGGWTPLLLAVRSLNSEMVKLLLRHHADPHEFSGVPRGEILDRQTILLLGNAIVMYGDGDPVPDLALEIAGARDAITAAMGVQFCTADEVDVNAATPNFLAKPCMLGADQQPPASVWAGIVAPWVRTWSSGQPCRVKLQNPAHLTTAAFDEMAHLALDAAGAFEAVGGPVGKVLALRLVESRFQIDACSSGHWFEDFRN